MDQAPKKNGRRYGLFGVSAYPRASDVNEAQKRSMLRWSGLFTALLAGTVLLLILMGSHSGGLTVTFDTQGGSAAARQSVPYGGAVSEPEEVLRPGYVLTGWSVSPDGEPLWAFDRDTVTETLVLYAIWRPEPG